MLSGAVSIRDYFRDIHSHMHNWSFGWITIKIHNKIKYLKVPTYDRPLNQLHVHLRSLPQRSMTLLSMDKVIPALDRVATLLVMTGLRCSTACLTIKRTSISLRKYTLQSLTCA